MKAAATVCCPARHVIMMVSTSRLFCLLNVKFNAVMPENITHHADRNSGEVEILSILVVGQLDPLVIGFH